MTTLLLIRHAYTDAVGRYVAGRMPNVALTEEGVRQLPGLVQRLGHERAHRLYCSPLERTRTTAEPLGRHWGVPVEIAEELNEIDFGEWTGRTFAELAPDPIWRRYNAFRSGTRIPGGEVMSEVQDRAVGFVQKLRERYDGQVLACVTHGDIVRAVLTYYLGLPMDLFLRVEIDPASVTAIRFEDAGPRVLYVNR